MNAEAIRESRKSHLARKNRRDITALSEQGANLLCSLWEARAVIPDGFRSVRALDIGSGFSSVVLRRLCGRGDVDVVYTLDTAPKWLQTTLYELEDLELNTEHCLDYGLFEQLQSVRMRTFHLLLLDSASTEHRIEVLPIVTKWLAPQGTLVLDDWHMPHYTRHAVPLLNRLGFAITEHPETKDAHGRFLATAQRR